MKQQYVNYLKNEIGYAYKQALLCAAYGDNTSADQWYAYGVEMDNILRAVEAMSQREFHLWWAAVAQPANVYQPVQLALL